MADKHFKRLGLDSCCGSLFCERVVPRDHSLVKPNQMIDRDGGVALPDRALVKLEKISPSIAPSLDLTRTREDLTPDVSANIGCPIWCSRRVAGG